MSINHAKTTTIYISSKSNLYFLQHSEIISIITLFYQFPIQIHCFHLIFHFCFYIAKQSSISMLKLRLLHLLLCFLFLDFTALFGKTFIVSQRDSVYSNIHYFLFYLLFLKLFILFLYFQFFIIKLFIIVKLINYYNLL